VNYKGSSLLYLRW